MAVARYWCFVAAFSIPLVAQTDTIARIKQLNGIVRQNAAGTKPLQARTAASEDFTRALEERAALFGRLVRLNQKAAREVALRPDETAELRASGVDSSLIETPAAYTGPAESIAIDTAGWTDSSMLYRLNTTDGIVEAYASAEVGKVSSCGSEIHVEGLRIGSAMLATYVGVTKELPANASCVPTGEQKVAVFIVNFPEARHTLTKSDIEQVYFDRGFQSIANHTSENSAGAASVSGRVFGPYTLDRAYSCNETNALRTAVMNAANADVDWNEFQHLHIVVPSISGGCGWAGLGTIGCNTLTAPGSRTIRASTAWVVSGKTQTELRRVATHELGHNYGVGHARTMFFPNSALNPDRSMAAYVEYGDPYSLMGGGGSGVQNHFAAQHKAKFGWIKAGETYTEVSSSGTFQLAPAEVTDGRVRALRIRRNLNTNEYLWVEYRQPAGMFDKDIGGNYRNVFKGALIRYESSGTGGYSELLNMNVNVAPGTGVPTNDVVLGNVTIPEGAVWQDPYSDLTVQVTSVTPDALTVDVRYDSRCASFEVPRDPISPAQGSLSLPITAPANCFWTAIANSFWLATTSNASGSAPASFTLAPAGDFARPGSITVGRRTGFITQLPNPQRTTILYVAPSSAKLPTDRYIFHEVGLQVPNGVESLIDVEVRWSAADGTLCGLRYNYPTRFLFALGDRGDYQAEPLVPGGTRTLSNGQCFVGSTFGAIRYSATESHFWFNVQPKGSWSGDRVLTVRVTDGSGQGPWETIRTETVGSMCFATTNFGSIFVSAGSGQTTFSVSSPGCDWQINSTADWLRFTPSSGTGTSTVTVAYTDNSTGSTRQGDVTLGENVAYINQRPHGYVPVDAILEPAEAQLPAEGGRGDVTVNAESLDVAWSAVASDSWIEITGTTQPKGISDGYFSFRVKANPSPIARQGTITAAGRTFGIYQAGAAGGKPVIEFDQIRNGASFVTGVTANAWITIKGINLARTTRSWAPADFDGNNLPTVLENVRVNINGRSAYVYYVSPTQLNVLAPAGTPVGSMNVEVITNGVSSGNVTVNGTSVMPAFFTFDPDESRYAAAVAADGSYVGKPGLFGSALATRPAKPGEFVQLYATGLGATQPSYPDGQIVGTPLLLRSSVSVQIGGRLLTGLPAYLVYAGVYQINVQIPATMPDGDATLIVNAGVPSPPVYITIKK
jgi:uncharacterized protein (TIGR03437 family)